MKTTPPAPQFDKGLLRLGSDNDGIWKISFNGTKIAIECIYKYNGESIEGIPLADIEALGGSMGVVDTRPVEKPEHIAALHAAILELQAAVARIWNETTQPTIPELAPETQAAIGLIKVLGFNLAKSVIATAIKRRHLDDPEGEA